MTSFRFLGADDVHVEHIIPQKIKTKKAEDEFGDWVTYLGDKAEAQHPKYVSRIGNLTIFLRNAEYRCIEQSVPEEEAGLQGVRHRTRPRIAEDVSIQVQECRAKVKRPC